MLTHNFSAEYGRNSGSVISSVTRSGTNDFHGSVYEFLRNNDLDARNFFNQGALPAYRRNQFGAAAGGPVKRNRVFFFANYEGLRSSQGLTVIAVVPDANARKGLVPNAATGQLQSVTLNTAVTPFLNLYPLPNGPSNGDGTAQYITNFSQPTTENYSLERMDFRLSDKDNFYARYVYNPSDQTQPRPVPIYVLEYTAGNSFLVLSETHVFSSTSVNEFRAAFDRTYRKMDSHPIVPIDPSLSFAPGLTMGTIKFATGTTGGGAAAAGLSEIGAHSATPNANAQNIFQESDTFSTVQGSHSLKFGADLERVQLNVTWKRQRHKGDLHFRRTGRLAGRHADHLPVEHI